jgi:hypothetical protein
VRKPRWFEAKEKQDTEQAREKERWKGEHILQAFIDELGEEPKPAPKLGGLIPSVPIRRSSDTYRHWIASPYPDPVTITAAEFQKAFSKMGAVVQQPGNAYTMSSWPKKKITDIQIDHTYEAVDVTSISDPFRRTMPGVERIRCTDQDGYPVPDDLQAKVERAWRQGMVTEEVIRRLIDEYNNGPVPEAKGPLPGHFQGCQYLGSDHFACTCQPPTLTGRVLAWKCICCDHPVADEQYGLCEMCQAHQDSYDAQVEADHEAALV